MTLLDISNLSIRFGGVKALDGVTMSVEHGEMLGIIGPNGAGKSTLLNCITGYYDADEGHVKYRGQELTGFSTSAIARLGISRTFQNIEVFNQGTVEDNVLFGGIGRVGSARPWHLQEVANAKREVIEAARASLRDLSLTEFRDEIVDNLPYPAKKRLEVARALVSSPKVLILDEPTSGMGPDDSADLASLLMQTASKYELTLVVIAHDMPFVFEVCDRVIVLDAGEVLTTGSPGEVRSDNEVIRVYLGDEYAESR